MVGTLKGRVPTISLYRDEFETSTYYIYNYEAALAIIYIQRSMSDRSLNTEDAQI